MANILQKYFPMIRTREEVGRRFPKKKNFWRFTGSGTESSRRNF